jgi:glutaredoxin 3
MSTTETSRVRVYSTTYCGYCRRAEDLLEARGIPFDTIDVTQDPGTRAWLVEHADGRRTVPVIFIDGQPIGGYQELARLAARGGLDGLGQARAA